MPSDVSNDVQQQVKDAFLNDTTFNDLRQDPIKRLKEEIHAATSRLEATGELPTLEIADKDTTNMRGQGDKEEFNGGNYYVNLSARQRVDFAFLLDNQRGSYADTLAFYLDAIDEPNKGADGIISKQDIDKFLNQARTGNVPMQYRHLFTAENVAFVQRLKDNWNTPEIKGFRDDYGRGDEIHLDDVSKNLGFSGDRNQDAKMLRTQKTENITRNRYGQITEIDYPDGSSRFEYDLAGGLKTITQTDKNGAVRVFEKGRDGKWLEYGEDGKTKPANMDDVRIDKNTGRVTYKSEGGYEVSRTANGVYDLEPGAKVPDSLRDGVVRYTDSSGDVIEIQYKDGRAVKSTHTNKNTSLKETFEFKSGQWTKTTEFDGKKQGSELLVGVEVDNHGNIHYKSLDGTVTTQFSNGPRHLRASDGTSTLYRYDDKGSVTEISRSGPTGYEALQKIGDQWILITVDKNGERVRTPVSNVTINLDGAYTYQIADQPPTTRSPYRS